jgi:hypothetical protein
MASRSGLGGPRASSVFHLVVALGITLAIAPTASARLDAALPLGRRFGAVTVTRGGVIWTASSNIARTTELRSVRAGRLEPAIAVRRDDVFAQLLPRRDGGIWFLSDHAIADVTAAGRILTYGPISGNIEQGVVDSDDSLTFPAGEEVADNANAIVRASPEGALTPLLPAFRGNCETDQSVSLEHGPSGDIWMSACGKIYVLEPNGVTHEISANQIGTPPATFFSAEAAGPDGSLWLLGAQEGVKWSLRRLTTQGTVEAYILPKPSADVGYTGLWVSPDGTPWISDGDGCTFVYLSAGRFVSTRAPLANALLVFDNGDHAVLWNDTEIAHISLAGLRAGVPRCHVSVPSIKIARRKSRVSIGDLAREGVAVAIPKPAVIFGSVSLLQGPDPFHTRFVGESTPVSRVVAQGGPDTLRLRFPATVLRRARAIVLRGGVVHLASGLLHVNNAQGISAYPKLWSRLVP